MGTCRSTPIPVDTSGRGFFTVSGTLSIAVASLLLIVGSETLGWAQCSGLCGDFNQTGDLTPADIFLTANYLYLEGAAPPEACADEDDYQLTTVRDALWLSKHIFKGGPAPICPPANAPYVSQPTTDYTITYNNVFPANQTSVQLDLNLEALDSVGGITLPLTILVDGTAPTFGTLGLDSSWSIHHGNLNPTGGPLGSILFGFVQVPSHKPAGHYDLADVELVMPPSGSDRPITLSWSALPPIELGQPVNYPMLVDQMIVGWEPTLSDVASGVGSISGIKFRDDDEDCSQALTEPGLRGFLIYLQPLGWIATTDDTGGYYFEFVSAGTYTLEEVPRQWYTQTCPVNPATYTVMLAEGADETGFDFGNQVQVVQDLAVSVAGSRARPGFEKTYALNCLNNGTVPVAADVELALPMEVTYLSSLPSGTYSLGPHTVAWSLGTLAPGSTALLQVTVQVLVETPLGSFICATATINPLAGDADPANNVDTECQEVRGSWDPNEKHVTPLGVGPNGWILREDTLRYHIDFQNTGNDTAFTVVIRDTVDADIDITTIHSGAASHPYIFTITNRELKWTFNNILLPDSIIDEPGSHGLVEYVLRPSAGAPDGADIPNEAGIYFDFNPSVVTNTVVNTICPVVLPGDVANDGVVTSADIIALVNYVFKSGAPPQPVVEAGDINCDGLITSADIISLVNYVFMSGLTPCDVCTEL